MAKTFGNYDKMDPDALKQEQEKLRNDLAKNKAGFIARTADVGVGAAAGTGAGLVAAAITTQAKSGLALEEAFSASGGIRGNKLAFAVGAAVALGALVLTTAKLWKDSSIKAGTENSARLSHVERVLAEKAPQSQIPQK